MASADLAIVLRLIDEATGPMKSAGNSIMGFSGKMEKAGKSMVRTGAEMSIISGPLAAIGVEAIKTAADFEGGMGLLQAVTSASAEDMAKLSAKAKELGADITLPGTSAVDAGEAMLELSKAGLSVTQTMAAAKGVLQLSAAANIENAQAAEIAANALNSFKLPGEQAATVANLLANAANASSIEITDAADSLKMAGSVFSAFQGPVVGADQALSDLVTSIGLLGNAGIKGSDAGTSLKQAMLQLTGPSNVAKGNMDAVFYAATATANGMDTLGSAMEAAIGGSTQKARDTGTKELAASLNAAGLETGKLGTLVYDAEGKMRSFTDIMRLTEQGTRNMTDAQRNEALTTIFGSDATRAAIILMDQLKESTEKGTTAFADMEVAVNKQGGAAALADARMGGFNGSLQGLQSAWETMLLEVAEPVLGFLTGVVKEVSKAVTWFMDLPAPVRNAALAFGIVLAVAGPLVLMIGGLVVAAGALAGPIGLIVLGVAGLTAVIVAFWEPLSNMVSGFRQWYESLPGIVQNIIPIVGQFKMLKEGVQGLLTLFGNLANAIRNLPRPNISLPGGFKLPGFAEGGMVPGPIGAPMLAMVHGGERVQTPAQQAGGGGAESVNINVVLDGQVVGRAAWSYLQQQNRHGSLMGLT